MENKEQEKKISSGLLPLTEDKNDFSHTIVFGALPITSLPQGDFFVSEPMEIKNQDYQVADSDFCAGYAAAEVSEDQEAILLNPEYTWVQAKKALGPDAWKTWGLNLRDICLAAVNKGFLEQEYYPFEYKADVTRDFIANPENWPEDLDMLAADHRKASFFAVDGPSGSDVFDNMRSVMYMNRAEQRSIITGVLWHSSWIFAPDGIIPLTGWENDTSSGHALKIFGWIWLPDPVENTGVKNLYLAAQLSNSSDIGDSGVFYFRRELVNKFFTFGAFTFKDTPKAIAQYHNENGLKITDSPFYKLFRIFVLFITSLFKK